MAFLLMTTLYCSSAQKAVVTDMKKMSEATVSYGKDIYPIMEKKCTPCHFPERGKKQMLDNYEDTKEYIADILVRIQLKPDAKKFMPFKSKKAPLTEDEVTLFKNWFAQGMAK